MAFRIRKPSQESFFALNAIPLYSYAIPLRPGRWGLGEPPELTSACPNARSIGWHERCAARLVW